MWLLFLLCAYARHPGSHRVLPDRYSHAYFREARQQIPLGHVLPRGVPRVFSEPSHSHDNERSTDRLVDGAKMVGRRFSSYSRLLSEDIADAYSTHRKASSRGLCTSKRIDPDLVFFGPRL